MTSGFVETFGVGVCRGRYSEALRREWHRWDQENGSENEEVDIFGEDQLFVVGPGRGWPGGRCGEGEKALAAGLPWAAIWAPAL